mgnify:CR=1 FL=1
MNPHALEVLEFARVLDLVAGNAGTAAGAARVRGLKPWEHWVTYVGAGTLLPRLRVLLDEFAFAPLRQVLAP